MADDFFVPDFEEDDFDSDVGSEQSQNRTFLIGAGVLAAIFVLGLCVVLFVVLRGGGGGGDETTAMTETAIAEVNLTNIAGATQTALAAQATPTPTLPDESGGLTVSPTMTSGVPIETSTLTQTPILVATQTTEPEEILATLNETQIAEGTTTPFETVAPSTPIVVTPLDGGAAVTNTPIGLATPTRISGGVGTGGTTGGTSGGGGSSATALPNTGVGLGNGVAGVGLLALALVAVVVVARRLRLS